MPKKTPTADNSWMYHRIHRASATTRLYPLRPRSGCRCCRSRRSPGWQESRLRFLAGLATNKQWIGLLGKIFTEISMDFPMKIMGFSGFNFPKKTNPLIARCHRELQGNAGSIYHHYLWMRFFNVKKHGRFIGDVHGIMHYFHKTWLNILGCAGCQWFGWFSRKSMVIVFTVSGWFLKKNQVICLWCACNLYIYICIFMYVWGGS